MRKKSEAGTVRKTLKLRRAGLHERAAARMRAMIISGELAPGSSVQETRLSEALGVSRTPLREAIKLLAAEGWSNCVPTAARASRRSKPIACSNYSRRSPVSSGLPQSLRPNAPPIVNCRGCGLLQTRMEKHHRDGRLDEYFAINGEIHGLIVRAAQNAPLREAHETLLSRAERARYLALGAERRWSNSVEEHAAILVALEARDGETAGRLLSAHVQRTGTALWEVLAKTTRSRPAA